MQFKGTNQHCVILWISAILLCWIPLLASSDCWAAFACDVVRA